jgi:hypothetical protein
MDPSIFSSQTRQRVTTTAFKLFAVLCVFIVAVPSIAQKRGDSKKEVLAEIKEEPGALGLSTLPKLVDHKHHDAVVRRLRNSEYYLFIWYVLERDTLREYNMASVAEAAKGGFDQVFYHWEDSSTVYFRLHDSQSKQERSFRGQGRGNNTELKIVK